MAIRFQIPLRMALAVEIAAACFASENSGSWLTQGNQLYQAGRYADAVQAFRLALKNLAPSTKDQSVLAETYEYLASAYAENGQLMESKAAYQHELTLLESLEGKQSLHYAFVLANMVDLFPLNEIRPDVIAMLQRAIATQSAGGSPDQLSMIRVALASIYVSERRYGEAEPLLEDALNDLRRRKVVHARSLIRVLNALAVLRSYQKRYSDALDLDRQFLELSEVFCGREHPLTVLALANMGSTLFQLGELDAAISTYQRALALAEKALSESDPTYASLLANYSIAQRKLGRKREAKLLAERSKQSQASRDRLNGSKSIVSVTGLQAKQ